MHKNVYAACLVLVTIAANAGRAKAYDDRNPLGSPLIPYRKVCEAPDWRFNNPSYNRLVDDNGVLKAVHQKRCLGENGFGAPPDKCAKSPNTAMYSGCINDVERTWALWAGLFVICDPNEDSHKEIYHACPCSCFAPETKILVMRESLGEPIWSRADQITRDDSIVTLGDSSTLGSPIFESREILYTTSGEEHPALISIETTTGVVLSLTQHHAVLLSDGRMITAKELTTDDDLVDWRGNPVGILAIKRERAGEMVYNVASAGTQKTSHLILAEGILVGDLLWQNSLAAELGEVAVRSGQTTERGQP